MAAKVEYNNSMITYVSRHWAQAAAFAAAVVTEQRLVHRMMCKHVLTAAVTVAKQRQQLKRQGKLAARDAAKAVRKQQQLEQEVLEADTPAERASRQLQEVANTARAEPAGDERTLSIR